MSLEVFIKIYNSVYQFWIVFITSFYFQKRRINNIYKKKSDKKQVDDNNWLKPIINIIHCVILYILKYHKTIFKSIANLGGGVIPELICKNLTSELCTSSIPASNIRYHNLYVILILIYLLMHLLIKNRLCDYSIITESEIQRSEK